MMLSVATICNPEQPDQALKGECSWLVPAGTYLRSRAGAGPGLAATDAGRYNSARSGAGVHNHYVAEGSSA